MSNFFVALLKGLRSGCRVKNLNIEATLPGASAKKFCTINFEMIYYLLLILFNEL